MSTSQTMLRLLIFITILLLWNEKELEKEEHGIGEKKDTYNDKDDDKKYYIVQ